MTLRGINTYIQRDFLIYGRLGEEPPATSWKIVDAYMCQFQTPICGYEASCTTTADDDTECLVDDSTACTAEIQVCSVVVGGRSTRRSSFEGMRGGRTETILRSDDGGVSRARDPSSSGTGNVRMYHPHRSEGGSRRHFPEAPPPFDAPAAHVTAAAAAAPPSALRRHVDAHPRRGDDRDVLQGRLVRDGARDGRVPPRRHTIHVGRLLVVVVAKHGAPDVTRHLISPQIGKQITCTLTWDNGDSYSVDVKDVRPRAGRRSPVVCGSRRSLPRPPKRRRPFPLLLVPEGRCRRVVHSLARRSGVPTRSPRAPARRRDRTARRTGGASRLTFSRARWSRSARGGGWVWFVGAACGGRPVCFPSRVVRSARSNHFRARTRRGRTACRSSARPRTAAATTSTSRTSRTPTSRPRRCRSTALPPPPTAAARRRRGV